MKTHHILLVEDNPGDARLIREMLKISEYKDAKIHWVENISDATNYLSYNSPDVVLADLTLPDSEGLNAVTSLLSANPDILIIVLTGINDVELAARAIQIGAQDYLSKNRIDDQVLSRSIRYAVERKKHVSALRESEEKYRLIVNTMGEGIIWTDNDDVIQYVNKQVCDIYGYSREELLGKTAYKILEHPDYRNVVIEKNRFRLAGISDSYEVKGLKKSGEVIWVRINGSPIYNNREKVVGSVGIVSDITEKKLVEEKLVESEKRYRRFFEEDLTGDYITSPGGKILFCNDALAKILKYDSKDDLLTHNASEFYIDQTDRKLFIDEIKSKKKIANRESNLKASDGSSVTVIQNATGSFDNKGELTQVIGYMFDITKRKQAEERQKLFAVILEHLNRQNEWANLIRDILAEIKSFTGFDAVGIRLKDGSDFPYYIQDGFAEAFIKEENFLCAKGKDRFVVKNESGLPVLECTCGLVLSGKTDISKPFFTEGGSFWTNQSSDLLSLLPNEDPRTNPRNNCIHSGYMSVALIPIHSGDEIIGLLQLNDKQSAGFTLDLIHFFEKIASAIGIAYYRMQSEKLIKQSEERYREVVEEAVENIFTTDNEGFFTYANPSALKLSGYSLEELKKYKFSDLVTPEYKKRVAISYYRQFLERESVTYTEYPFLTKSGEVKWFGQNGRLITDNGDVKGFYIIARDITEIIIAKQELEKLHLQNELILKSAGEGILGIDIHDKITFVNPTAARFLGYQAEELIGMNSHITFHHTRADGSNFPDQECQISSVYEKGEIFYSKNDLFWKKEGTSFPVEYIATPIYENGVLTGAVLMFNDISERLQAESEILKLSQAVEQSPVSIIITDLKGNMEYVNTKLLEITGYAKEELIGKNPRIFSSGEKPKEEYRQLWSAILAGSEWFGEFHNKKKNGELYWEFASISPIIDAAGKITHYLAVKEDITERKINEEELIKAKEKAEESDRLKSAFLANMSHEIRTPMNGILGFTELLLNPDLNSEEKETYINIVHKSGQRMLNTVNDIVEISKIEAGLVMISNKEIDLNEAVNELAWFFLPEAEKKGLELSIEMLLPEAKKHLPTDRGKLDSIITNLIKNAVKYTDSGTIKVGCRQKGSEVEFYVKDTGIGIPAHRHEAVFNRFEQADIADTRAFQGSGLGLAIAKSYVEMLGGKIRLESREGFGSTFYFTLPAKSDSAETQTADKKISQNEKTIPKVKGLKILIAEDDEPSRKYLSFVVNHFSAVILEAETGIKTIELCRQHPDIDLVLMDVQMPGLDGYEAALRIREFNKEVIIIAQTAFALKGDREKAIGAGCNDYIAKPIKRGDLLEIIQKHFNNKM
jgi:PAS domain S-box-containing protein